MAIVTATIAKKYYWQHILQYNINNKDTIIIQYLLMFGVLYNNKMY